MRLLLYLVVIINLWREIQVEKIVSIIFPVKNEGENVKNTLDSLSNVKTEVDFQVVIVNDGSQDGCCDFLDNYESTFEIIYVETNNVGASNARNVGAEKSNGKYLVFCDAHLYFEEYWLDKMIEPIVNKLTDAVTPIISPHDKPTAKGYGQTLDMTRFRAKWNGQRTDLSDTAILSGGCFSISREVFNAIGGFERRFRVWGFEDIEFSIKMWLFGYRCSVLPTVQILHIFRKAFPYQMSVNFSDYNMIRLAYSHFSQERIEKCKEFVRNKEMTESFIKENIEDGVMEQRESYFARRMYDDSWFFEKFSIDF